MDILDKFQLKEWWLQALTASQRELIESNYRTSLGGSSPPSIYQNVETIHFDEGFGKFGLLLTLSSIADEQTKQVIITKTQTEIAQEYTEPSSNLIDIHVALASIIKHHYSLRSEIIHYDKAKELCLLQIAIASKTAKMFRHPKKPKELVKLHKMTGMKHPYYDEPQMLPSHTGYKQLAIILEKEGDIKGALKLAKKALKQGWTDDYEKRIERLSKKLAKQ